MKITPMTLAIVGERAEQALRHVFEELREHVRHAVVLRAGARRVLPGAGNAPA